MMIGTVKEYITVPQATDRYSGPLLCKSFAVRLVTTALTNVETLKHTECKISVKLSSHLRFA